MTELERFDTPYQSLQPLLWKLSDSEWLSVIRVPPYVARWQRASTEERQLGVPFVAEGGVVSA